MELVEIRQKKQDLIKEIKSYRNNPEFNSSIGVVISSLIVLGVLIFKPIPIRGGSIIILYFLFLILVIPTFVLILACIIYLIEFILLIFQERRILKMTWEKKNRRCLGLGLITSFITYILISIFIMFNLSDNLAILFIFNMSIFGVLSLFLILVPILNEFFKIKS